MKVFDWLTGQFSRRGKSLLHNRRGMALAKKHDHQAAIAEYTQAIEMASGAADVKAMALYNRALEFLALGDEAKGIKDLNEVVSMPGQDGTVKTRARQKLVRMGVAQEKKDLRDRQESEAVQRRGAQAR